jgi:hypothetical protein
MHESGSSGLPPGVHGGDATRHAIAGEFATSVVRRPLWGGRCNVAGVLVEEEAHCDEVLLQTDLGFRRGRGAVRGDRLLLRGRGHHHRRGHRLGRRHDWKRPGLPVDRADQPGGYCGGWVAPRRPGSRRPHPSPGRRWRRRRRRARRRPVRTRTTWRRNRSRAPRRSPRSLPPSGGRPWQLPWRPSSWPPLSS